MRKSGFCLLFSIVLSPAVWAQSSVPDVIIDPGGVPPQALKEIQRAVSAITRLAEDQDLGEVSRLRRRAHDATVSALQTQGYFDSVVTLEVGEDSSGEYWDIIIQPGEITRVRDIALDFKGKIQEPEYQVRLEGIKASFPLKAEDPFLNSVWSSAKADLLESVQRQDFYYARYIETRATVLADEGVADLSLKVDSGPRVRMGPLETTGLKRVPQSLIDRYVRYTPGDPYDQDKLDEWQQSLAATTFFRGAFVTLDEEAGSKKELPDGDVELPVHVRVTEAPSKQFTGSLGFDSDHGARVEALYRKNIVFGLPVWSEAGIGVDKNRQRAFYDIHLPPTIRGYKNSFGVLYDRSDVEGLDTERVALGWKLRQERKAAGTSRVEYETEWGLLGAWDKTKISGLPTRETPSAIATWQWLRRDVDKKYDPREGNLIDFGVGAGVTLDRGERFYRSNLRLQQWWPVGDWDVLSVRGEIGKVWGMTDRTPPDFGYRTGGARSIRGYKYQSIGLGRSDAVVGAPAMAVASVEYTHFFTSTYGMRAFVDVGDAASSFGDMDLAWGYGLGAVVRTPAGPFNLDLAYGQRDKRLRLSFSLGIAF
ncbi:autotransporter assembly complex protein TamA [Alcaligenes faecalis]|uniref:autotransporter assembly complex protein TamA n=1 Tax=Alcaligenes faecalis TaxID=511 RepID=UPI0029324921|nr:BamA/TamA family outer membrane protein [Alcaligenes faecalis]MDV2116833.1 BamA/TamA family outer membrane protein [Alcaligenes faecalis]